MNIAEENYMCPKCAGIIHKGTLHVSRSTVVYGFRPIHAECSRCDQCALPRFEVCAECFRVMMNEDWAVRTKRLRLARGVLITLGVVVSLWAITAFLIRLTAA